MTTLAEEGDDIEEELAAELNGNGGHLPGEEREVVELYDLPPVFQKSDDDEPNQPTTRKIETVLVFRRRSSRDMHYLGWKTIDEVHDLDALLQVYGPGTYQLAGRGMDRRRNIKVIFQTVGDEGNPIHAAAQQMIANARPTGLDIPKLVAAATAIAMPLMSMLEKWRTDGETRRREELEREEKRHERDRERDDQRTKTMLELVGARNQDLVTAVKALQEGKASHAGGTLESYQSGMVEALEIVSHLKEAGLTNSAEDFDTKALDIIQSLIAGGKKGAADAEKVINQNHEPQSSE